MTDLTAAFTAPPESSRLAKQNQGTRTREEKQCGNGRNLTRAKFEPIRQRSDNIIILARMRQRNRQQDGTPRQVSDVCVLRGAIPDLAAVISRRPRRRTTRERGEGERERGRKEERRNGEERSGLRVTGPRFIRGERSKVIAQARRGEYPPQDHFAPRRRAAGLIRAGGWSMRVQRRRAGRRRRRRRRRKAAKDLGVTSESSATFRRAYDDDRSPEFRELIEIATPRIRLRSLR